MSDASMSQEEFDHVFGPRTEEEHLADLHEEFLDKVDEGEDPPAYDGWIPPKDQVPDNQDEGFYG